MITQKGIAASPGFAIGKAFVYRKAETAVERLEVTDVEGELEKLNKALSISKQELEEIKLKTAQSGRSEADIFQAQLLMLEDPRLLREIRENVTKEKVNIEASVQDAIERHAAVFDAMSDPYFRARAADVRDVGARILKNLQGRGQDSLDALTSKVIVVAQNLAPSDTGRMNRQMVLGFATDTGGLTAHTAILARSLRIPAVVGLRDIAEKARAGMDLIVDGINGIVVLEPTNEAIAQYEREKTRYHVLQDELEEISLAAAVTLDGRRMEVGANIGSVEEADLAASNGADGIGLLRTEFLYLDRKLPPSEEELFKALKAIAGGMKEKPVLVRTLDVGGDKPPRYLDMPHEENPFLGWRGIRISLEDGLGRELFKTQLRAILRAATFGNLRIMLPMISDIEEIRAARQILGEVKVTLATAGVAHKSDIELGAMIETPAAAIASDVLAKELDFFSIGTNDLIQYSMAADRTNDRVSNLYQPLHPAVLRLIKRVIDSAHEADIWVGMCGEMAGDPMCIPILIGLGLDEISMAPFSIPIAKKIVRSLALGEARQAAQKALASDSMGSARIFAGALISSILERGG